MLNQITTLKSQLEQCLIEFPETANSDIKLTNAIWYKFYREYLFLNEENELCVKIKDLYDLPKEDTVKRIRAKFNSEGKYLPTDPEVIKQRKLNEIEWHEEMRPSNPSRG